MCVDLKERQAVMEEMRLVLSEQEETQTQMELELENRETQIHQLMQGNTLNTRYAHQTAVFYYLITHTHVRVSVLCLHKVCVCVELENLKELLLKQRNSKQFHHHEQAHNDDITRAKEEVAQAQDNLKVRLFESWCPK